MSQMLTTAPQGAPQGLPLGGGVSAPNGSGLVRTMSPSALTGMEAMQAAEKDAKRRELMLEPAHDDLAAYVRKQFEQMRRHRDSAQGWSHRLTAALRAFNGEYDPDTQRVQPGAKSV